MKEHVADATIAATAQKFALGGGGTAVWGAISANWVAAIGGILIGLAGLCVQIFYKHRDEKRKAELHRLRVEQRLLRPYEDDTDG